MVDYINCLIGHFSPCCPALSNTSAQIVSQHEGHNTAQKTIVQRNNTASTHDNSENSGDEIQQVNVPDNISSGEK